MVLLAYYSFVNKDMNAGQKTGTSELASQYVASDFVWTSDGVIEKDGIPYNKLVLEVKGKRYTLGDYVCNEPSPLSANETNQLSASQCWFGGGGDQFAVFFEDGKYMVKSRQTGEGAAEYNPPVFPWKTMFILD